MTEYVEKPHWKITHLIFAQIGASTNADVLRAYGTDMIEKKIQSTMLDPMISMDCDDINNKEALNRIEAEAVVFWKYRSVIDRNRFENAAKRARILNYDGDPDSRSPLNPLRLPAPRSTGEELGVRGNGLTYHPLLT